MSGAAPLTRARLWLRGLWAVLLLSGIGGAFLLSLEAIILDLDPQTARLGREQTLIFLPVVLCAVLGWMSILMSRVYPLLREEPSREAYRAALALPADFVRGALVFVVLACAVDLALQLRDGRVEGQMALAMDALAAAEAATLLVLGYVLMRRVVRPVLHRLRPALVEEASQERLGGKLLMAVAIPVTTFALALASLTQRSATGTLTRATIEEIQQDLAVLPGAAARALPPETSVPFEAWTIVLLTATLSALVGGRLGHSVARDLHLVTVRLDALAKGLDQPDEPRDAEDRLVYRDVRALAAAILEMAHRFDELAAMQNKIIEARSETQRIKSQFLTSMSHDLRSPLNSIIGFSELLLRGIEGPLTPVQRETVQIVHKSGNDLLRLINDILDTAKLEAGRMDIIREWTPSVEILNETIRRSRELVGDKDIDMIAELQPGLPPVFVDADRISQAILHIIANAFKFMEQGTVRVLARIGQGAPGLPSRYLQVEIADTGSGIREEDRESIFEAFRQIDGSSSRRSGGMGLGLALARAIVELHGGKIWVESRLGAGSVFYVAVPLGE